MEMMKMHRRNSASTSSCRRMLPDISRFRRPLNATFIKTRCPYQFMSCADDAQRRTFSHVPPRNLFYVVWDDTMLIKQQEMPSGVTGIEEALSWAGTGSSLVPYLDGSRWHCPLSAFKASLLRQYLRNKIILDLSLHGHNIVAESH